MTDQPAPADIEVEVEDEAWIAELGLARPDIEALIVQACALALSAPRLTDMEGGAVVILLADDAAVRDLNARFRGQDKATNVLSFPASANPEGLLGDIALALGVCAREAREQGKSLANHVRHMTVHGTLHLLGYDHDIDAEAEIMEALECTLLAELGVPDPYGAPAQDHG